MALSQRYYFNTKWTAQEKYGRILQKVTKALKHLLIALPPGKHNEVSDYIISNKDKEPWMTKTEVK